MDRNNLKRKSPVNEKQKVLLTEFMNQHIELVSGKFTPEFTFKKAQLLWEEIGEKLNNIANGPKKEWREWRKTWQDLKKSVKSKFALNMKNSIKTGGGPQEEIKVSELEENILETIPSTSIFGVDTNQPKVSFHFEEAEIQGPELIIEPSKNKSSTIEPAIDHAYSLEQLTPLPKKRLTKTRRLQSSLKILQEAVNGVGKRTEILQEYYEVKKQHLKETTHHNKEMFEMRQLNKNIAKTLQSLKCSCVKP